MGVAKHKKRKCYHSFMPIEVKHKPDKNLFEKFMIVFALVEPLATIPQIYQVWSSNDAAGVSLTTWFFYMITAGIWLIYGIRIKDKPVIVSGVFWTLAQGLVVCSTEYK